MSAFEFEKGGFAGAFYLSISAEEKPMFWIVEESVPVRSLQNSLSGQIVTVDNIEVNTESKKRKVNLTQVCATLTLLSSCSCHQASYLPASSTSSSLRRLRVLSMTRAAAGLGLFWRFGVLEALVLNAMFR